MSRAIQKYLSSKGIPSGIKCYVEHYRTNLKFQNYEDRVEKHYGNYTKKHIPINILLCTMIAVLICSNIYEMFAENNSVDLIVHRLFITTVSYPAIFYIYNYCDKIMWVKGRVGAFVSGLFGILAIIFSYFLPNLWGIFLGGEIIIFSLCIRVTMTRHLIDDARRNLIKDFWIFLFIGITISVLGVIFLLFFSSEKEMTWQHNLLKYSYYVLFTIYTIMSNINHIKYSYICNKIGYSNMFTV